jgi:uncharacterized sulfatase
MLAFAAPTAKPLNVVWIVAEDISPDLGCYGVPDAITPNLDRFAAQGAKFTRAFTHAPVCAPSRSGLITGRYPTTLGSHHMRSKLVQPPPLWTDELRKAGVFVAWPGKTDFNFDAPKGWADTHADWTKKPELLPKDRPFFAYINYTVSHESQARAPAAAYQKNTARLTPEQRRDRAKITLPTYYPDTPEVRESVAKYHENITAVDYLAGDVLTLLEKQGLAENTVVFFFGDHGRGLPRHKRWPIDAGLRVPMMVRWPGTIPANSVRDDLVCFLDLGPTVMNILGVARPERLQGRAFLGANPGPEPQYLFAARDRMDEAPDRIRSVRDRRYRYVRNYHPEIPYFQWVGYLDQSPIMQAWRRDAFAGKLNPVQAQFFARTKPAEELYDLETDPWEVRNLAADPAQKERLTQFRAALDAWIRETGDLGEVDEKELIRRGIVKDVLSGEYTERVNQHPKTPPVP